MTTPRPILVVALGMHRSGTSISTRALTCLGVELGNELLPGGVSENPTGFFEDSEIHELSLRVLEALGTHWDGLDPLSDAAFETHAVASLRSEAVSLLRRRLRDHPVYGFKNPRTPRLLRFWQPVFEQVGADLRWVCMLRHPLSVARSLEIRNGFDTTKSLLLWLTHTVEGALAASGKQPAACLDYDALLRSPRPVLEQAGEQLQLGPLNADALARFEAELLDPALAHSRFEPGDLNADPNVTSLVRSAYELLLSCAQGEAELGAASTRRALGRIRGRLRELAPLLSWADEQERRIEAQDEAARATAEQNAEALNHRESMITEREGMIAERDATLARQNEEALELQIEIDRQRELLAERETDIVHLRQEAGTQRAAYVEAERRIENLWELQQQARADHQRAAEALHARLTEAQDERCRLLDELSTVEARVEERHASQTAELENEAATLREQLAAVNTRLGQLDHEAQEAQSRLVTEQAASQVLHQQLEAERQRVEAGRQQTVDWFHGEASRITHELLDASRAFSTTRTWQTSRRFQRAMDRLRRRRSLDATDHLEHLMIELLARAQRHDMDARALADIARMVDETSRRILTARIFRSIRSASGLARTLGRRPGVPGPAETLERQTRTLLAFAETMSQAPISTALPAAEPAESSWVDATDDRVDIVIPVYGDTEATLDCIASVRRCTNQTPIEIVVIDDATPEPALARALDQLDERGEITLLRNESNLGFPTTANRGLALHADRDVILLNADTRVSGNWVDRMRAAAHADWNVATVTPFSNNAEICSYPELCQSAQYPGVREQTRIDETLADVNAGRTLTIPTAVGFCMYLRRDALNQVGPFDAMRFERGYGEENDLCMRMRARGLRNVLAADVYVAHSGGASFGAEKQALVQQGLERLAELYPDYQSEVAEFIADDPMKSLRVRGDAALLQRAGEPTLLFVTHDRGGGTERHVLELASQLSREGVRVLMLSPDPSGEVHLHVHGETPSSNLHFHVEREFEDLIDALRIAGVSHVHFHHLIGLPDSIARLPQRLDITYDVTAHDYYPICPRVHLIDDSGVHCAEPDVAECTACVARNGSPAGYDVDVAAWRERSRDLLAGARRVFVPSQDTYTRLERYFDDVNWCLRPHAEAPWTDTTSAAAKPGKTTRVAVIGAIGYHKGSQMLLACAQDAAARKLPLTFSVIGYTDCNEELLATKHVEMTGPYEEADLAPLVRKARCQMAFLPSVWPETYCYALSGVLRSQLQPVVFDLGAPAERVAAMDFGTVLPLSLSPGEVNDRLLAIRPAAFPRDRVESAHVGAYATCLKDYYDGLTLD